MYHKKVELLYILSSSLWWEHWTAWNDGADIECGVETTNGIGCFRAEKIVIKFKTKYLRLKQRVGTCGIYRSLLLSFCPGVNHSLIRMWVFFELVFFWGGGLWFQIWATQSYQEAAIMKVGVASRIFFFRVSPFKCSSSSDSNKLANTEHIGSK